jgi:hypothetical protein
MYASDTVTAAGRSWRVAANALILEAQRISPLQEGILSAQGSDDENAQVAQGIDEQITALLEAGDRAVAELLEPAAASVDARFQATSLLVGSLAVGDALAMADPSPSEAFVGLTNDAALASAFAAALKTVAAAEAAVTVPKSLAENLEKIEAAGATESWELLSGSAGVIAGGALVSGLDGVLSGAAAAAFDALIGRLSHWRDAIKHGVLRIAKWVVDKLKSLLPASLAEKVDKLVDAIEKSLADGLGQLATNVYGTILGRAETEKAWQDAAAAGKDLSEAEQQLAALASAHTGRVAWVTSGRKIIEKHDSIAAAVVAELQPQLQLAFAALVAAVLGFVAFQVWDGFNDIQGLI